MKAIVVDDSQAMRLILGRALKGAGFEVTTADDGQQGLTQLQASGPFDVALVDWNMPVMTGYELLCKLRSDKQFDGMPIMMVTTEKENDQVVKAKAAGANEYLFKPFTPDLLKEKLSAMGLVAA